MVSLSNSRRQRGLPWSRAIRLGLLLSCLLTVFVPHGNAGNRPENNFSPSPVPSEFAIADFDGDSRPDLASVHVSQSGSREARYLIDFRLTSGLPQTIGVTAPEGGLHLRSSDVNGDSYPDVVVTTFWTNQPVAVLLNDGRGNFSESDPSAFPGAFTTSGSSRISKPDAIKDATAVLFSRYIPGRCEECEGVPSPLTAAGRLVTSDFLFAVLSRSNSFFGRAPPTPIFHR